MVFLGAQFASIVVHGEVEAQSNISLPSTYGFHEFIFCSIHHSDLQHRLIKQGFESEWRAWEGREATEILQQCLQLDEPVRDGRTCYYMYQLYLSSL